MTVHLIHVGYPKTGSTFLRRWFDSHHQVSWVEAGVAGFGSAWDIPSQAAGPDTGIVCRVTSCEGLATPYPKGEGAPVDYDAMESNAIVRSQAAVCAMLADLFPTARILLVTRGFRSVILSSFSQYARTGGHQSLDKLIENSKGGAIWDYGRLVETYIKAFGAENVIVMPYELLRDDVHGFIRQLEARLGLSESPVVERRLNPSLSSIELWWFPRLSAVARRLPIGLFTRTLRGQAGMLRVYRLLVPVLQLFKKATPVTQASIPDHVLEPFRGKADGLRNNPLYARYAGEYLF